MCFAEAQIPFHSQSCGRLRAVLCGATVVISGVRGVGALIALMLRVVVVIRRGGTVCWRDSVITLQHRNDKTLENKIMTISITHDWKQDRNFLIPTHPHHHTHPSPHAPHPLFFFASASFHLSIGMLLLTNTFYTSSKLLVFPFKGAGTLIYIPTARKNSRSFKQFAKTITY